MKMKNDPGVPLTGPARLIAIVVESTDLDQKYQPIIQWGGDETNKNSVLFMEYEFDFDNMDDQVDTFTAHDTDSMLGPIFVIDCGSDASNFGLVCHDPDTWHEMFYNICSLIYLLT